MHPHISGQVRVFVALHDEAVNRAVTDRSIRLLDRAPCGRVMGWKGRQERLQLLRFLERGKLRSLIEVARRVVVTIDQLGQHHLPQDRKGLQ